MISILLICTLTSGLLWAAWALTAIIVNDDLLVHLPTLASLTILTSSLILSYNLVPILWLLWDGKGPIQRSLVANNAAWALLSYPVGVAAMCGELAILEIICRLLEKYNASEPIPEPGRLWRGDTFSRGILVFYSFNWGFCSYWFSTFVTLYVFDRHHGFVSPYSWLGFLGLPMAIGRYLYEVGVGPGRGGGETRERN